jgi:hypothetical protein
VREIRAYASVDEEDQATSAAGRKTRSEKPGKPGDGKSESQRDRERERERERGREREGELNVR